MNERIPSYRGTIGMLYNDGELVASVRASEPAIAKQKFIAAGLIGTHVIRAKDRASMGSLE